MPCARCDSTISPARPRSWTTCVSLCRQPAGAARVWTTRCSSALRDWARRPSPTSSPTRWAWVSRLPADPCSTSPATWPAAHLARAQRRALHRRDTPSVARGGGVPLLRDGGLPHRHHDRQRSVGAHYPDRPQSLHAGRRHHPKRPAHRLRCARFRHQLPPGVLRCRHLARIVRRSAACWMCTSTGKPLTR